MEVLIGINPDSPTVGTNRKSLRSVNIIKLKSSGKLKDRMCANVAPHHKFLQR